MKPSQTDQKLKKIGRSISEHEREILAKIATTDFGITEVGGKRCVGGLMQVIQKASFIASEVGLGGCRSITEFINMVDNEDPAVLDLFVFYLSKKKAQEAGVELEDINQEQESEVGVPTIREMIKAKNKRKYDDSKVLESLLLDNGITREQILKSKEEISSREIKIPQQRLYSSVTSADLMSEDFKFEEAMKQINEDMKNSKTFKISLASFKPMR